jgi:predicted nucleic acid-binding protein
LAIVVSDTSPIRALAHLNRVDLLATLFDQVLVPPAVDVELRSPPSDLPFVDVRQFAFVLIQAPSDLKKVGEFKRVLDPGESEALALALEVGVSTVLIDEAAGRSMAKRLGLSPIGVLGLLLRAKQRGLVALVEPLLDQLENDLGFFISGSLRAEVLRLAGELSHP